MKSLITCLIVSALLACAGLAHAQAHGSIELTTRATQPKTVTDADGHKRTTMVPAARVVPGTEVTYTITYHNIGTQPAGDVVVHDPVPPHMSYVAGSAQGANTTISYSIDGGGTWAGSLAGLTVKSADGSTRPATAADCTNVRWVVNDAVAPGDKGSVSFRAVLQ